MRKPPSSRPWAASRFASLAASRSTLRAASRSPSAASRCARSAASIFAFSAASRFACLAASRSAFRAASRSAFSAALRFARSMVSSLAFSAASRFACCAASRRAFSAAASLARLGYGFATRGLSPSLFSKRVELCGPFVCLGATLRFAPKYAKDTFGNAPLSMRQNRPRDKARSSRSCLMARSAGDHRAPALTRTHRPTDAAMPALQKVDQQQAAA